VSGKQDVGFGAVDDAGGAFAAWGALSLLNAMNITPKRTIRAVFWNAEGTAEYHCSSACDDPQAPYLIKVPHRIYILLTA